MIVKAIQLLENNLIGSSLTIDAAAAAEVREFQRVLLQQQVLGLHVAVEDACGLERSFEIY